MGFPMKYTWLKSSKDNSPSYAIDYYGKAKVMPEVFNILSTKELAVERTGVEDTYYDAIPSMNSKEIVRFSCKLFFEK